MKLILLVIGLALAGQALVDWNHDGLADGVINTGPSYYGGHHYGAPIRTGPSYAAPRWGPPPMAAPSMHAPWGNGYTFIPVGGDDDKKDEKKDEKKDAAAPAAAPAAKRRF